MRRSFYYFLPISFLLVSCSFSNIGSDLGDGLVGSLAEQSDTIAMNLGSGLIRGIRDSLANDYSRRRISMFLDSIISGVGDVTGKQTTGIRDSLLNDRTRDWLLSLERDITFDLVKTAAGLREQLLGDETKHNIAALRNEILGYETSLFFAAMRDTLVGSELRRQVGLLRDEILGPKTQMALDSIIIRAADHVQRVTREEEGFLKRNIVEILWTVGAILALLLVLGSILFRRVKKTLGLITNQIYRMPNKTSYNELTGRIKNSAMEQGVESFLRKFLIKQGSVRE